MKKTISLLILFLSLLLLFVHPMLTVSAAANGLMLWYQNILPALLPFAILSDILITSGAFYHISGILYPLIHKLIPCSRNACFPLLAGFLFGFPMGSRICAQMLDENQLSKEEATILFVICNNISPMFIASYIVHDTLQQDSLLLPTLAILYLPPLILCRILYAFRRDSLRQKETAPRLKLNFSIIDAGIMNGFEILCKLGGYIMLFSILLKQITFYVPHKIPRLLLSIPLEVTNGIHMLSIEHFSGQLTYALILSLTAFGGFCGFAQTYSMVIKQKLSIGFYLLIRILLAFLAFLLSYCIYPA